MTFALVHMDESCLGNGREGTNPGGAGGLIEIEVRGTVERRDVYLSEPASTNNRMALIGAAEVLEILASKGRRLDVLLVSDSEYLVKGMREWVPGWEARGWRRKGGEIINLELWQRLVKAARQHNTNWMWVRGHQGHAKNEYANDLAVKSAKEQVNSNGAVPSGLQEWLEKKRTKGHYLEYDPDADFRKAKSALAAPED